MGTGMTADFDASFQFDIEDIRTLFYAKLLVLLLDVETHEKEAQKNPSLVPQLKVYVPRKVSWISIWWSINQKLLPFLPENVPGAQECIAELKRSASSLPKKKLMLIELMTFPAYIKLEDSKKHESLIEGLKIEDKTRRIVLRVVADNLGVDSQTQRKLEKDFSAAIDAYTEKWKLISTGGGVAALIGAITLACLAGPIAGLIGSVMLGNAGAAAFTSGLAYLGFGSIASGGLGMAGGLTVLVGGGSLVCSGLGGAAGLKLAVLNFEGMILEMVKFELSFKSILIEDRKKMIAAYESLRQTYFDLVKEYDDLLISKQTALAEKSKKKVRIFEVAVQRLIAVLAAS